MKKIIITACFLILGIIYTVSQNIAPDFTLSNTDGVSVNLYNELSEGKSVYLCFFSISCGPCAEEVSTIQEIIDNNDENLLTVMPIEIQLGSNEQIEEFITQNGGNYKGFSTITDNNVLSDEMFDIDFAPQNIVICSDKRFKKVDLENVELLIANCQSATKSSELYVPDFEIKSVFPGDELIININAKIDGLVKFEIIDMLGNIKLHKSFLASVGDNILGLTNKFEKGYYIMRLYSSNEINSVKKIVIY